MFLNNISNENDVVRCAVSGEQQAQTRSDHPFAKNKGNT